MGNRSVVNACFVGILLTVGAVAQDAQEGVAVKGVVVDAQGNALSRARIGTGWWFDSKRLAAYGSQDVWPASGTRAGNGWKFVPTDMDGSFDARVLPSRGKVQLTVFSADEQQAGTFVWDQGDDLSKLKLRLEPVARFRATIICTDLGKREVPATCYLRSVDRRRLGRFHARDGTVDLKLPAGHYTLHLYGQLGQELGTRDFNFMVTAGEDATGRDIDVPANSVARYRGRTMPPLQVTEARGLKLSDATMEHFRGKWLLVALWQYRSHSATRLFPKMLEFDREWREANPGKEPPYAIVLLHSGLATSLGDLDAKIAKAGLRETHWGGRPLPWPVLIDPERKTAKSWGLRWSSQALWFDPEGKLWGETIRGEELHKVVMGLMKPAKRMYIPKKPKPKQSPKPVRRKDGK